MQHPDPRGTGARGKTRKVLASNKPVLAFMPRKINCSSTATLEKPRPPYPILWKPDHTAPGTALAGIGGAS